MEKLKNTGPEAVKNSIFDYYSVENEVNFVKNNPDISDKDKKFYLQENVLRFLGEFVGKVPYAKISYFQKDQDLYFPGMQKSAKETYWDTALKMGADSREYAEAIGFSKINQAFAEGANFSYWVSPPSNMEGFGDYGFVFAFVKEGEKIDEYILRYDEKKGDLKESKQILGDDKYCQENDFLRNPYSFVLKDPHIEGLSKLMRDKLKIDDQLILQSERFDKLIDQNVRSWLEEYSQLVIKGDNLDKSKQLISAIYNYVSHLNLHINKYQEIQYSPLIYEEENKQHIFVHFSQKESVVEGGGSCPVSTSSNDILAISKNGIVSYKEASWLNQKNDKTEWEYHTGNCACCGKKDTEVGPCNICKICEKKFD